MLESAYIGPPGPQSTPQACGLEESEGIAFTDCQHPPMRQRNRRNVDSPAHSMHQRPSKCPWPGCSPNGCGW
eukprot:11354470-Alexandrium_andersonii.AAC.1